MSWHVRRIATLHPEPVQDAVDVDILSDSLVRS